MRSNKFDSLNLLDNLFCSIFRYIMVARVCDGSGEAWISIFNEEAERIIGCSADELNELKSQVNQYK